MWKIPILNALTTQRKDGEKVIKAYRVTLQKSKVENISKLKKNDELIIEYKKNKIIIRKKED